MAHRMNVGAIYIYHEGLEMVFLYYNNKDQIRLFCKPTYVIVKESISKYLVAL